MFTVSFELFAGVLQGRTRDPKQVLIIRRSVTRLLLIGLIQPGDQVCSLVLSPR